MRILFRIMTFMMLASCTSEDRPASEPAGSWENILKQSRGTTVYWMMWQGDPMINRYVQEYVVSEV
ncbi:MAG: hypothetical protein ACKOCH_02140, partial [Bacteroidota bacterium]